MSGGESVDRLRQALVCRVIGHRWRRWILDTPLDEYVVQTCVRCGRNNVGAGTGTYRGGSL